ncbi:MAG: crotonase [Spirochaetales bacterium]|nr:MAG: crotonase [Spirochaetales bacterium]
MKYEDIRIVKKDRVATIFIDRPKVLNAIRHQTMLEIQDVLRNDIINDDGILVVVLTGAGDKAFISGGDISIMNQGTGYIETVYEVPNGQAICTEIENFPKPVVARINGLALGGGTEVALSCDIRIASTNAKMGLPEIRLGIIPGYGGTQRLPRLVGMGKAKELIMTGDHISAEEAYRIGLVNQVVPPAELDAAVDKMTEKLSSKGAFALHMAKTAINNGAQTDLKTALALEAMCFGLVMGSEDKTEGMTAFLEKRKAQFKGR